MNNKELYHRIIKGLEVLRKDRYRTSTTWSKEVFDIFQMNCKRRGLSPARIQEELMVLWNDVIDSIDNPDRKWYNVFIGRGTARPTAKDDLPVIVEKIKQGCQVYISVIACIAQPHSGCGVGPSVLLH